MKRIFLLITAAAVVCLSVAAQNQKVMNGKNTLVAYFSATGTTERVAEMIAETTGGDLYEITSVQEYTASYDVIYIGYPIWWNLAPRAVNTFLDTYDFSGKTVIPFATSGGSGITNSAAQLKKEYPSLNWQSGKLLNDASKADIEAWVNLQGRYRSLGQITVQP